jgi:hypothetical protein
MRILRSSFRIFVIAAITALHLQAQISVVSELSQDKEVRPGGVYSGAIILRNDTNEPQEAKVYQTDYTFQYDGTNQYGTPGTYPRSNAKWIDVSPSFVSIPPKGVSTLNYTVTVPKETDVARLTGTYWSMLMVEGIARGSAESSLPATEGKTQVGIVQNIRYGVQIATTIEKTGEKNIRFIANTLSPKKGGKRSLDVDIENTGQIGIRPKVYVELFNSKGVSLGQFPSPRYRIYPGTSVRQNIDVSKVANGTYKALVAVDAGGDNVFGAQYTLIFK